MDATDEEFFLVDTGDSPMNPLTSGGAGAPFMKGHDVRKIDIQTITLDTFCNEIHLRPNVVKIDVDGAALLGLRGASKLLSESCPAIILAVHPYWLPKGKSTRQIFEFLTVHGYTVYDSTGVQVDYLQNGEYLCLSAVSGSAPVVD
jgi:hypothetical protein